MLILRILNMAGNIKYIIPFESVRFCKAKGTNNEMTQIVWSNGSMNMIELNLPFANFEALIKSVKITPPASSQSDITPDQNPWFYMLDIQETS